MKHFISLADLSADEVNDLLVLAGELKEEFAARGPRQGLRGKLLGLIFEKESTRTRFSMEAAMAELGGGAIFVDTGGKSLDAREPVKDLARVYSGYCAALALRTFSHETILEMARHAEVPVINGLSDYLHPCQALADLLTIRETFGRTADIVVGYVGDANNVARSLAYGCALSGAHLRVASPTGYQFEPEFLAGVQPGEAVTQVEDPSDAVREADVVYTDVWSGMGQEQESESRRRAFAGYQVTPALMREASPRAIFMHCLPAHRGEEVAEEVMEGPQSVVFQQAENRKHAQKAVLWRLLG